MNKIDKFNLRLVCISDTHLFEPEVPDGDVLIHAGDITNTGSREQLQKVNDWFGRISKQFPKGIILVPGNHDWLFENNKELAEEIMSNATILHDKDIIIDDCHFYGTSWQPQFMHWAFNVDDTRELQNFYNKIPYYTDVLITHCPPYGILDKANIHSDNLGSHELSISVNRVHPRVHVFGHVHGGAGSIKIDNTLYINGASCDERYSPVNKPIVADI